MKAVDKSNYRQDKYYPDVIRAMATILARSDVIAPVEVLRETHSLDKKDLEAWRHGQVAFLEKVLSGNLSKAMRVLRLIALIAGELGLRPSQTAYHQWGKESHRRLRFSKSGDPNIENAYSRHFLWARSPEEKQAAIARMTVPLEKPQPTPDQVARSAIPPPDAPDGTEPRN